LTDPSCYYDEETGAWFVVVLTLELDPNNTQIRQNYELFKEINDRTSGKEKQ